MMNEKEKTLNRIKIENIIWVVYLFIVGFNLYSNKLETIYVLEGNPLAKKRFKKINTFVLSIVLIIYIYFVYIAYQDVLSLNPNEKETSKFYTYLILLASVLFLIGGAISLYVTVNTSDIDEEIPIL